MFRGKQRYLAWLLVIGVIIIGYYLVVDFNNAKTGSLYGKDYKSGHVEWPEIKSAIPSYPDMEKRISNMLERMSLDQKIGQMLQVSIHSFTTEDLKKYNFGSVLNGGGSYPKRDKNASVEKWVAFADTIWLASMDKSSLQIPIIWGTDALHGNNNKKGATIFPHNIGLGAANDPELIKRIGEITAKEVAVTGLDWTFAPVVAVVRDDRWGRTYESYSEDPEIVDIYAKKIVEGLQGNLDEEHILATAKHYIADGGTQNGDDRGDNKSTEKELRDIHAKGYFSAISAGVQTIMVSYSSWNGEKMHGHKYLLTEILKNKLGFDGFIISDWNGIESVEGCTKSNCAKAVNAGIDMFMTPFKHDWKSFIKNLKKQVESGEVPISRIDDAVTRILRVKFRARMFDKPQPSKRKLANKKELLGSPEHREIAREAVRKSLVLLKNKNNILPLTRKSRILVAGKSANSIQNQTGGWTLTWQGNNNSNSDFPGATSVLDAIKKVAKKVEFDENGSKADKGKHDVAIVVIGETPYAEFKGDIENMLTLEHAKSFPEDIEVIKNIKKSGVPIVTIFISGRPLYVNQELNRSDAFVAAWLPGSEGDGIADVIFKNENDEVNFDFTGKLSFSWPKSACQTCVNRNDTNYNPLFPYRYGLSYQDKDKLKDNLPEKSNEGFGCTGTPIKKISTKKPFNVFKGKNDTLWRPWLGDPSNWDGISGENNASLPNIAVKAVDDKNGNKSCAKNLLFKGEGYWALVGNTMDLTPYLFSDYSLVFDIKINSRPEGFVSIAILCEFPCMDEVDITGKVNGFALNKWNEIRIPLNKYSAANFKKISSPFMLKSSAKIDISIANIRWES